LAIFLAPISLEPEQSLHSIQYLVIRYNNLFSYSLGFETKVLKSLDQILDRQKKLEEQVASFLLTQGASDDLLEDLIPKTNKF
jgi:hypothetical protein